MLYATDAAYDASGYQMFEAESRHLTADGELGDALRHLRDVKADHEVARLADVLERTNVTAATRDYHYRRLVTAQRRVRALGGEA